MQKNACYLSRYLLAKSNLVDNIQACKIKKMKNDFYVPACKVKLSFTASEHVFSENKSWSKEGSEKD